MTYFSEKYPNLRFPIESGALPGFRSAQIAAVHALSAHFFGRKEAATVVMPTGSGKTCVMLLAAFMLRAKRVLVVTPSRMVRDQIGDAFRSLDLLKSIGALDKDALCPKVAVVEGRLTDESAWEALRAPDVIVSTIQSVSPGIEGIAEPPSDLFDLICCDEAHHTPAPSWRALLDHFAEANQALFTATPFRRDAKLLRGRVVFEYPLSRARDDGVFGQLRFQPVEPIGDADPDLCLAKAAQEKLLSDQSKGLKHAIMVRTSQRSRAEELAKLYETSTVLRLRTVFGDHSQGRLRKAVADMKQGALDGVICVDMLGEGFDLPNLKIAVLHSPHHSLAVTLQFIGRFARTTGANTGEATFLAIPSEIKTEAERLYVVGAEWNEIVEEASRKRIEAELESREVLDTFESAAPAAPGVDSGEEMDLSSLAPYFHVKIIEVPGGVDLARPLKLPIKGEPLLVQRSDNIHALVCVTRHVAPCRWTRQERVADVSHELFILFFDEPSKLLFILSSRREVAVYDAIVESVALGNSRRLSPAEVNRVLRGIDHPSFFSIGMRNRSGFGNTESYRMIAGKAADRAIQKDAGRFHQRGHAFGQGDEEGIAVTIGFSSSSKVWANERGDLAAFFRWCRKLAIKLLDKTAVVTNSNLDYLPLAVRATAFPSNVVVGDWHERVYANGGITLAIPKQDNDIEEWPLLDFGIQIRASGSLETNFVIEGHARAIEIGYRLDRFKWFDVAEPYGEILCREPDGQEMSLADFLHEYPPSFFTADLRRLEGDDLSPPPNPDDVFDVRNIETIAWGDHGVDPLREKPDGSKKQLSLFEWLQKRLESSSAVVIFNDDGSGEVADYVALLEDGAMTRVELYHCKAASKAPIPGDRVDDLYEVAGQAAKCVRITDTARLREHLVRRCAISASRLVRGTAEDVRRLLADGQVAVFRILIVQPGVGASPKSAVSHLLAAANSYLVGAQAGPLQVIGSK